MRYRVFIDTNVFIYAFEYPESNSAKVLRLLSERKIEAVISEQVVKEVIKYFEKYHSLKLARLFRRYLLGSCILIQRNAVLDTIQEYANQIKEKDLEQIAITKKLGIRYLIAYDRDFENFTEYITPKNFIKTMKIKEANSEY